MMRGWILAVSALLLVASGLIGYRVIGHYQPPPSIQGAYLQPSRELEPFSLVTHENKPFEREDLKGQWHLVSYGYTHCPDICPMTLARLASMVRELEEQSVYPDLQVLFYSVDGERDRPDVLAEYVPYFHPEFTGLTRSEEQGQSHQRFEQSLGILAEVRPEENQVDHGVMLLLLNPRGRLQAIFEPERNEHGLYHFTESQLIEDYRAVRAHYAGTRS